MDRDIHKRMYEWARPTIAQQDRYRKYSARWNAATVVLLSVLSVIYWFYVQSNLAPIALFVFLGGLGSAFLKDVFIKPSHLTLPQLYAVNLVRIVDLGAKLVERKDTQMFESFDDAILNAINQMDSDLGRLENDLAAAKTWRALSNLRSYLLRFSTALKNPEKANRLTGNPGLSQRMRVNLEWLADEFFRFAEFDRMDHLATDIDDLKVLPEDSVTERSKHIVKVLRKWYSLPPPVNVILFTAIGIIVVWIALPIYINLDVQTKFVSLVAVILAVIALFAGSLKSWLQAKLYGE